MKLHCIILFLFLLAANSFASAPDTLWTKTFGGSNIDVGHSVFQTNDNGYIISGYTRSFGTMAGRNDWLVKTNSSGEMQWNKTFGGTADEEAFSVQQTTDSGYVLCGYTKSYGAGLSDVQVIKTDKNGNLQWEKMFGGASDDEGYSVIQTTDGGFIIAGATSSNTIGSRDAIVIKTNALGNELWKKNYGGLSSDGARCIQQTSDGGYIITGWTFSNGASAIGSLWLLKINSSGIEQWNKIFKGADVDRGYSVKQTQDGGYILTGYTSSFGNGLDDMLLIKTDASGNEVWKKYFGGTGRDYGNEVHITPDGGYIIAGYTLSFGAGSEDFWLVKTDTAGNLQWSKTMGGTSSDVAYSLKTTNDGGFIVTGHTLSRGAGVHDVWLVKLSGVIPVELTSFSGFNNNGQVVLAWSTSTEKNNKGFEIECKSFSGNWDKIGFVEGTGTSAISNNYTFTHNPEQFDNQYRLKQIDFDDSYYYSKTILVNAGAPKDFILYQNYPNPFNPETIIKYSLPETAPLTMKVFDVVGKEIETIVNEIKPSGNYEIKFDAKNYSSGIYFYTLQSGSFIKTQKMVVLR